MMSATVTARAIRLRTNLEPSFQEKECLNICWKIKHFSYCVEIIQSPDFNFCGYKWCLQLNPKAVDCEIICLSPIKGRIRESEISFQTSDGSTENSFTRSTFQNVPKDIIFEKRRNAFLPKNVLKIRCRLKTAYERGNISIESLIGVKRKCFLWTVKEFSQQHCSKNVLVENSDQYGDIQMNLKSVGGINSDEQFYLEISRTNGEKCYCILKISVMDVDGRSLNYISDEFIFEKEGREQIWRYPPIIRKSKLLACKNLLLPNDTLSLKCEFAVTLGKVTDQTAVYNSCNDITSSLGFPEKFSMCFPDESSSASGADLKTDLKHLLDNGILCDASLQVGSDIIQVHKNILSARSPVFKAMFTKDMKETINDTVEIIDLDADTVRRLLLYMYTDTIHECQWENIMHLYFAADKYEVLSLKEKCSTFLKANLSFSNMCEVLVLADLHQDADLKAVVHDFLSKYDSEVFASEAWKDLEKNNSSLAFQTLRDICLIKRLD
ncbi:speckle-type POZ protein B-like [Argiope bruennichi]|uniref:speckle-type POZ protein B-like n=1 Tax=Argiope bruennichi TaxID=94029 RepID=UPI0024952C40|nr:speckle-type POZ protein B-like [Argiope bruennichi]